MTATITPMRPQTPIGEPRAVEPTGLWVSAAPFAAHVRALQAQTGLSSQRIAVLSGVPVRVVQRLSRPGERLQRVRVCDAQKLFSLDATTLRRLDRLREQRLRRQEARLSGMRAAA